VALKNSAKCSETACNRPASPRSTVLLGLDTNLSSRICLSPALAFPE
jgi:hypothetical protein